MSTVNRIANPDFSLGKKAPRRWVWTGQGKGTGWKRDAGEGVAVVSSRADASACWSQVVAVKAGEFYRCETIVTCQLEAAREARGLVLRVEALVNGRPCGAPWTTPALRHADEMIAIRSYFKVPEGVRHVRISVGVVEAVGRAQIIQVRFIPILEPDETSHLLAVPPPLWAYSRPKSVRSVGVCSAQRGDRLLAGLLAGVFGASNVRSAPGTDLHTLSAASDAVFLLDPVPPPAIRTLEQLYALASCRIVIISLPAFARLTRGSVLLRRVEQMDDPIHAKVTYAHYATTGFALNDTFIYAWPGRCAGSFLQNQFRRTKAFRNFCDKHRFETMLVSMCAREVTSNRPICLYKPTAMGGLYVLDIEPVEAPASTFGEPTLAMHLLLSILGATEAGVGQYTVPFREESQFRDAIRQTGFRCEQFVVHDADAPVEEVERQLVTIGGEDKSCGLPLKPRPVILVRSGLSSGDVESDYGVYLWLKQLVRTAPAACPYAHLLATRFRLAWVPCAAPWAMRDGWRRTSRPPSVAMELDIDDASISALIDVVSCPANRVRAVLAREDAAFRHYTAWLPALAAAFSAGNCFAPTVPDGEAFNDRRRFAWRKVKHDVAVAVAPDAFTEPIHRDTVLAGGTVIRVELPGNDADFVAHSIHRTSLAATLLELVIGLQYGIIAVNRSIMPVHFNGFPPVGSGEALIVDRDDPILQSQKCQVG